MAITIKTKSDLKFAFYVLHTAEKLPGNEKVVDDFKRAIRRYYHKPVSETRIVKEYGIDGYITLLPLPEYLKTIDGAREYFEDVEYIQPFPSAYDCTGRPFTSWYKVFQRGGRFWAYHAVSFDV